jgi:bacterioferritin
MLSDWGLDKFAQYEYAESMDEMKHADVLIQRILFLEGLPNMSYLGNVYIAKDPIEVLHNDLKLENEAIPDLRDAILACEKVNDFVSRDLLHKILESEEEHVDHLETQLDLLEKVGNENFLQSLITSS